MSKIWFTSDTHFGHGNILRFCERPFKTIQEHDRALIEDWNARVGPLDPVYHLGDFAFGSQGYVKNILSRLNGQIHLLLGNHDKVVRKNPGIAGMFASTQEYLELRGVAHTSPSGLVVLSHYPFETWNKSHYGSYHFHGHCHGKVPGKGRRRDVGVDVWGYRPVSLGEIVEVLTKKSC